MIALGLADNSFHQWALREKDRVLGKKDGPDKQDGQKKEEPAKKGEAK